jgi:hypothetical protein
MTTEPTSRLSQVLWLNAPRPLEFRATELGHCAADQINCETIFTAISPGTELAAYTGVEPLRPGRQYPWLQGYCNVACVTDVGASVTSVRPGQLSQDNKKVFANEKLGDIKIWAKTDGRFA